MDKIESVVLYKELLTYTKNILSNFLKNVPTFKNQLSFNDINFLCYKKMYEEIKKTSEIKKTQDFYKEIPGLKELYNEARRYYLIPRNKSIKGLDVQLGKQFAQAMIDFLNSKKIITMRADTRNKRLPDLMILDKTRNIKAYIELKYHNAPFILSWRIINREPYEGSITLHTEKIKKQIIEIDSELERPVYFVHWVDFPDLKGIFFNTNEQIKDYLDTDVYLDRAGAYGIQDKKCDFVKKYKGSYTNILGLPLEIVKEFLIDFGISL